MNDNKQVSLYDFKGHQVRVVELEGNPWFVAADVNRILYGFTTGLAWVMKRLDADEKSKCGRTTLGMKPGRDAAIVSESGLYKLIMRSDKPEAKVFQDWVTREVLPRIRKDGMYVKGEEKLHPPSGCRS